MPTLQDILENDLGLGSDQQTTEKTASEKDNAAETDDIEKLAMEIGLVEEPDETSSQEETTLKKEAGMSLENLYGDLFPGDADIVGGQQGQEKVAEEEKTAAVEEAMGEVAYDYFQQCVDGHITKMAQAVAETLEKAGESPAPAQALANNEHSEDQAIDTDPKVEDSVKDTSPEGGVGDYEQKKGPMGELKHAAVRKHLLLAQLEK
jgi:hypothetical protein